MVTSQAELVGTWFLRSFRDRHGDGTLAEGPLGPDPRGVLTYTAEGRVSVAMMRGDEPERDYMSYAGTWRVVGDTVVHTLDVAQRREWLGTEQVRSYSLSGGRLTLTGNSLSTPRERVLEWCRYGQGTR